MNEDTRYNIDPKEHIRNLFKNTKDGKMDITIYPITGDEPFDLTYNVDWSEADAEALVQHFDALTKTLEKFAGLGEKLDDEASRKELLTPEENELWGIFMAPFEPFEVPDSVISELWVCACSGDIPEEEQELLNRFFKYRKKQSLKRLPYNRCAPDEYIVAARRYECAIRLNASEIIKKDEALSLAEAMVLYYYGPQVEDCDE